MTIGSQWSYAESPSCGAELAIWRGDTAPATRAHFHDTDQITMVLTGSRRFSIAGREHDVHAGQILAIPKGVAHQSVPHHAPDTHCVNMYLAGVTALDRPRILKIGRHSDPMDFLQSLNFRDHTLWTASLDLSGGKKRASKFSERPQLGRNPIANVAKAHGLSREGFSRAFGREFGTSPHAFRLITRLNEARRRLRSGFAIASVAAELGFADQSHFGRHFHKAFGVTPKAYADGVRRSHTFQT